MPKSKKETKQKRHSVDSEEPPDRYTQALEELIHDPEISSALKRIDDYYKPPIKPKPE